MNVIFFLIVSQVPESLFTFSAVYFLDWVISFFFKIYFIYLFLSVLGLRCGTRASHCGGFSCCGARALGA